LILVFLKVFSLQWRGAGKVGSCKGAFAFDQHLRICVWRLAFGFIGFEVAETSKSLSGKSDIFAYIPFYLHKLLSENGKIGLILSNAWLGTDYGEIFLELIQKFYNIETVVISGKGKWFDNADVVTTFLIAKKRKPDTLIDQNRTISFCTLKENINEITDIKQLSENILLEKDNEFVAIQNYSVSEIMDFESIGVPWCPFVVPGSSELLSNPPTS
jgi:hypothetical protein